MPSIRSLKPDFWDDEPLARLGSDARLIFQALWNLADDYGRLVDDVGRIFRFVFAAEGPMPHIDRRGVHAELERIAGLGKIVRYSADGRRYIAVARFDKHQKPRRRFPSQIPQPPAALLAKAEKLRRAADDRLNLSESIPELPIVVNNTTSTESPPNASAGLSQQTPAYGNNCPPGGEVEEVRKRLGAGKDKAGAGGVKGLPAAREGGKDSETASDKQEFDFEDDVPGGLSAPLKQELHTRVGGILRKCFAASDRWGGGLADRWLSDLGAAIQAGNCTVDELEHWLSKADTRPDMAYLHMDGPLRWLGRMFAQRRGRERRPSRGADDEGEYRKRETLPEAPPILRKRPWERK